LEEKMSKEEWINALCRNHMVTNTRDLSTEQVQKWLTDYINMFGSVCTEESFRRSLRKGKRNYLIECGMLEESDLNIEEKEVDPELIEANVRFKKDKQKFMDTSRVERKAFRDYARVENAVSELAKELVNTMKEQGEKLSQYTPPEIVVRENKEVGVVHISDTHFSELINLPSNQYDFQIASCRLFKFVQEAKKIFLPRGIKEIVVAFTGDLINSTRRMDEILNQATIKSKAIFVAVDLLNQVLMDLSNDFKLTVVSVLGNESRVEKEMSFSNEAISDNYDFIILSMLKTLIKASKNPNISFGEIDKMEMIINIMGQNVLLTHDVPQGGKTQKGTQSMIGMRYLQGTPFDVSLSGHIHAAKLEANSYRSSSLAGSNTYNEHALHLTGRASQNLYIFGDIYRVPMTIDLQNYNKEESYNIDDSLVEYECKSHEKTKPQTTILKITV
jgi:predicted MPP superfamily phosphohydrolase